MLLRAKTKFCWGDDQNKAFESLKTKLTSEPVLQLYNPKQNHEVHTDASALGIAGILMQDDEKSNWKVVFFYSRQCTDAEKKYHSYELEVLAIVESLERFRMYLLGKYFRVITDCSAVNTVKQNKALVPRIARWLLKLQEFNFDIIHRSGKKIPHADALSRFPCDEPRQTTVVTENIMRIEISKEDWLVTMQKQDEKLCEIIRVLKGETTSEQLSQLKTEYKLNKGRLFHRDGDKLQWVVPKAVRWRIVKACHDDAGHFGLDKTLDRIKKDYWFPQMRRYVKQYITACIDCCYNKNAGGKPEAQMYYSSTVVPVPFRVLHLDHLGPFPRSRKGNTHVLAIVDAFSKFLVVKAVRNTKTQPVLQALSDFTSFVGLPVCIITDRGTSYTSRAFTQFCSSYEIQHIKTATRTPRANGQVERLNQSISHIIRITTERKTDWDQRLNELQWIINSQRNSTTGFTPNEIVFDFKLRDVTANKVLHSLCDEEDEKVIYDSNIAEKREETAKRIIKERMKWKARFDLKHNQPRKYVVNDLVVIENVAPATGEPRKLEPKYRGPYIVTRDLGRDRYLVEDLDDHPRRHKKFNSVYTAEKMKPWCELSPELDDVADDLNDEELESGPDPSQERPNCQTSDHLTQHHTE